MLKKKQKSHHSQLLMVYSKNSKNYLKTAKRKRRTHKKLSAPSITIDAATGNYVMGHRVDRKTGMYKGRQVLDVK